VASVQACDDDQAKAHRIIEDYLTSHPKLSGIFAVGLWAVLPAGQILEQKKLTGKIQVVGFDTLPEELELVKKGSVQVLVGQKPYQMGVKAVELMNELHQNGKLSQEIYDTGTDVVTSANIDQFLKK
jgi:ribose transport system substrate-binding protein